MCLREAAIARQGADSRIDVGALWRKTTKTVVGQVAAAVGDPQAVLERIDVREDAVDHGHAAAGTAVNAAGCAGVAVRVGIAGECGVDHCRGAAVVDAATVVFGQVAGERRVAHRQDARAAVVDAAAIHRPVQMEQAALDGQRPDVVEGAATGCAATDSHHHVVRERRGGDVRGAGGEDSAAVARFGRVAVEHAGQDFDAPIAVDGAATEIRIVVQERAAGDGQGTCGGDANRAAEADGGGGSVVAGEDAVGDRQRAAVDVNGTGSIGVAVGESEAADVHRGATDDVHDSGHPAAADRQVAGARTGDRQSAGDVGQGRRQRNGRRVGESEGDIVRARIGIGRFNRRAQGSSACVSRIRNVVGRRQRGSARAVQAGCILRKRDPGGGILRRDEKRDKRQRDQGDQQSP